MDQTGYSLDQVILGPDIPVGPVIIYWKNNNESTTTTTTKKKKKKKHLLVNAEFKT